VFCEVPVDPRFAPLGVDPRFAELVRGKSGNTRAHAAISVASRWTAQDTVCHTLPSWECPERTASPPAPTRTVS
jgi:hypothetical protein